MPVPENLGGWGALPFFTDRDAENRSAWDRVSAWLEAESTANRPWQPLKANIFKALELTQPLNVRVVILGRDPYFQEGVATGLSFSQEGQKPQGSLAKMFAQLRRETGVNRTNPNLKDWADKGVLLINRSLTVKIGAAGSHEKQSGWQGLATDVLRKLSQRGDIVFFAWGSPAVTLIREANIDLERNLVVESAHPSAGNPGALPSFSATEPFSKANQWLIDRGIAPIQWGNP